MERLTKHFTSNVPDEILEALGIADVSKESIELTKCECETCPEVCKRYSCANCPINEAFEKLAVYEDAEEQGVLLKLPCKVGSELYVIRKLCDGKETRVIENVIANSFDLRALQRFVITSNGHRLNFSNFGKAVFLTKEEAEQVLAEMKEV